MMSVSTNIKRWIGFCNIAGEHEVSVLIEYQLYDTHGYVRVPVLGVAIANEDPVKALFKAWSLCEAFAKKKTRRKLLHEDSYITDAYHNEERTWTRERTFYDEGYDDE